MSSIILGVHLVLGLLVILHLEAFCSSLFEHAKLSAEAVCTWPHHHNDIRTYPTIIMYGKTSILVQYPKGDLIKTIC